MANNIKNSARGDIRNFLIVFLGGIAAAFVFAGGMIYYYGPSGRYDAKNVLITPALAANGAFKEGGRKKGAAQFIFDDIAFSYYDGSRKVRRQEIVPQSAYQQFYDSVSGDRSSLEIDEKIKAQFADANRAVLLFKIRAEDGVMKPFLEVHFLPGGDYYRVQLREEGSAEAWAYFYHPKIYNEAMQLFGKPS